MKWIFESLSSVILHSNYFIISLLQVLYIAHFLYYTQLLLFEWYYYENDKGIWQQQCLHAYLSMLQVKTTCLNQNRTLQINIQIYWLYWSSLTVQVQISCLLFVLNCCLLLCLVLGRQQNRATYSLSWIQEYIQQPFCTVIIHKQSDHYQR